MVEENGNKDNRKVPSITTIYDQWMYINSKGYKISNYFETNNCYNIAIYGMGCLGNRLYEELKGSSIRVIFGVDKNAKIMRHEIPICMVESDDFNQWSGQVDMMVVAALSANNEIKTILQNKFYKPIVSLADIIAEMMEIN
jgi:hypothetical protein